MAKEIETFIKLQVKGGACKEMVTVLLTLAQGGGTLIV